MISRRDRLARAFTLLEFCVVAGTLSVLVLLIVGGSGTFRKRSQEIHCVSNIRQVGSALLTYVTDRNGHFPFSGETLVSPTTKIWAGSLYHESYLPSIDTFYCPQHPREHRPERRLLEKSPHNAWANISYGASKFSLMTNNGMLPGQQPARLFAIRDPGKVLMLAEARVIAQSRGGWYQFWADFAAAADPHNEETIVYGRHDGRAALMYCDGRVEVTHVRNELYKRTNRGADPPWYRGVYTKP